MGLLTLAFNGLSQQQVIALWTEQMPYRTETDLTEVKSVSNGGSKLISDIVAPEILFFKSNSSGKRPVVLICPGGGYAFEAYEHEGTKVAEWFNTRGIHAAVLKYRLPDKRISSDPVFTPLTDALQAMKRLNELANDLSIDQQSIGIMGFSAGGHLAASASTLFHLDRFKDQNNCKPAFSILMYPVISMSSDLTHQGSRKNLLGNYPNAELVELFSCEKQVSDKTPPTFILHATDDMTVKVDNTHAYAFSLEQFNVPHKKVIFDKGGHGFGFREGAETNKWTNLLEDWLRSLKMIEQ